MFIGCWEIGKERRVILKYDGKEISYLVINCTELPQKHMRRTSLVLAVFELLALLEESQ